MDKKKALALPWFLFLILWGESVIRITAGNPVFSEELLYIFAFSCFFAMILYALSHICRPMPLILSWLLTLIYIVQDVYYRIFGAYLICSSLSGADQAAGSMDVIFRTLLVRAPELIILLIPTVLFTIFHKRFFDFGTQRPLVILLALAVGAVSFGGAFAAVKCNEDDRYYFDNVFISQIDTRKFGLLMSQSLDVFHLVFGFAECESEEVFIPLPDESREPVVPERRPQKTVNLNYYARNEQDPTIKEMDEYFASREPTYTNEYTGRFEGKNLILITAESFSQYCIDEELTPTLYKLFNEGFRFNNFYTTGWGVSTTDGEYVHLTGLIPKSGVWSFKESAGNSLPFTLGMQSKKYGYKKVNAYHNHTYTFYKRNLYLSNIGYDYKGVGNGLVLAHEQWPNSDLEMMQSTVDEYIDAENFSVYYMTVSGHGGYLGNNLSRKNFSYVEDLPYSFEVKNYLAANIELDRAIEYLIERLDEKGILEDTVISISADHYPYLLDDCDGLDELAGHKVDQKYERYENAWLLWCGDMTEGVDVDKYCSSLDILPTLSNMMGFAYDSRLLMGTDVMSDTDPVVIFQDQSWISQNGSYDALTGEYIKHPNAVGEDDKATIKKSVRSKFAMSRQILETDYYSKVVG